MILEVLDARDPLGSRCQEMEDLIISSSTSKRLVLVLNKIGNVSSTVKIRKLQWKNNGFTIIKIIDISSSKSKMFLENIYYLIFVYTICLDLCFEKPKGQKFSVSCIRLLSSIRYMHKIYHLEKK